MTELCDSVVGSFADTVVRSMLVVCLFPPEVVEVYTYELSMNPYSSCRVKSFMPLYVSSLKFHPIVLFPQEICALISNGHLDIL
jgi:hypothetical protein